MLVDDDTLLAIVAVCLKRKENEKRKRKKRLWVKEFHKRSEFTYQNLLEELKMSSKHDFRNFLNDASIYEELLRLIGPLIKKQDTLMRDAIPVGIRLSTTLRFLATGNHFEILKFSSEMSPHTISKIVLETCEAIISRLKDYMKLPESQEEWKAVAEDFYEKCNFPCCLGAVNGKHIAIIKPNRTPSLYYNYKNFFSIVLMAVVNANYEFVVADVDIGGGSLGCGNFFHTSFGEMIYENSLNEKNLNWFPGNKIELPCVFVGDDAFQLTEQFIKPFKVDDLTQDQQIYNYRLSQVHQIAENTFGTLFSQFGVLQKPISLAPEKVKTIVLACCYLYNFLRRKTDPCLWDIFDNEDLESGILMDGSWREVLNMTPLQTPSMTKNIPSRVEKVREKFIEFFTNEGKVP